MSMGYILMIIDVIAVLFVIIDMFSSGQHHKMVNRRRNHIDKGPAPKDMQATVAGDQPHQKEFHDDEIFSFANKLGIDFIKLIHAAALFAQGWFMVRDTKLVVR